MDKLEAVVPGSGSWSRKFEEIRGELRSLTPQIQYRRSKDYAAVVDMRPLLGVDAMVHFQSRYRGDHKIELLDSGEKSFEQCLNIIATITDEHPLPLEVRRVDLCANTPDVPVSWYASTIRAQWKQWEAKMGTVEMKDSDGRKMQWAEMGRRVLQTIYLGRRPNCFRIYDKIAEQYTRWQQARRAHLRLVRSTYMSELADQCHQATPVPVVRESEDGPVDAWSMGELPLPAEVMEKLNAEFPFPTFETWSGLKLTDVLTRVEREMAGGRVPTKIDRVYKLKQELADFNPFIRLKGFRSAVAMVSGEYDYSPIEWLAGVKMQELLTSGEWSRHQLYQFLNRDRNGSRYEKKFQPFLDAATRTGDGISAQQLYENYRDTVTRQLAA